MKLLLVGSTGLVGHHVLDLALADRRVDAVIALVRRGDLPEHTKLLTEIVDFEHLPEETSRSNRRSGEGGPSPCIPAAG